MLPPIENFLVLGGGLSFLFLVLWARQLKTKNANMVDGAWALSFGVCSLVWMFELWGQLPSWRPLMVGGLLLLWSLRLGFFLLRSRVWGVHPEDARYRRLREQLGWGAGHFFVIYQMQVVLVLLLSLPIFVAMSSGSLEFRVWDALGVLLFIVSILGESVADRQLHGFKMDSSNRGKTCQVGLWRYSRHPNYFFEWVHWWAYVAFAVGSSYWWVSLVGPLVMIVFLLKLTGVAVSERQSLRSRPDYADYQRTTSVFVPWFRKQ